MKVPSIPAKPDRYRGQEVLPTTAASAREHSAPANSIVDHFRRMGRAEFPLSRVFWRDMVVIGTIVNVIAIGLAFLAAAGGVATGIGLFLFMAPTPYNIFLVVAVWRRADREGGEWAWPARIGSLAWLLFALMV